MNRGDELNVYNSIDEMDRSDLNFALKSYVFEVRKIDGNRYPSESLRHLVVSLFHHLKHNVKKAWDIFNDSEFSESRSALDSAMKLSTKCGVGVGEKRKAQFIPTELEDRLWEKEALSVKDAESLFRTLVYKIGLHFGLRAREEYRALEWERQIKLMHDPVDGTDYLSYTKDFSKTNQGGLKHRFVAPKHVKVYENKNSDRCLVRLYKIYKNRRPSTTKTTAFYLQSMPNAAREDEKWFKDQPVGINKIGSVVTKLMKDFDKDGHYTNHSLKRTCYSRLRQGGIATDKSMKRTGHRSLDGAMEYDVQSKAELGEQDRILNGEPCSSRETDGVQIRPTEKRNDDKCTVDICIRKPNGEVINIKL